MQKVVCYIDMSANIQQVFYTELNTKFYKFNHELLYTP